MALVVVNLTVRSDLKGRVKATYIMFDRQIPNAECQIVILFFFSIGPPIPSMTFLSSQPFMSLQGSIPYAIAMIDNSRTYQSYLCTNRCFR